METKEKWQGIPDVSSFDTLFELNKNMDLQNFEATRAAAPYLEKVSYDVTQAKFYDQFNNLSLRPEANPDKMVNITLKKPELEIFRKNGFVVREMAQGSSFADEYLTIFENDLPVFITTDSVLHAFSTSYDTIMSYLEITYFMPTLQEILRGMLANLKLLYEELDTSGPLRECCQHADFYLTTALSLLTSRIQPSTFQNTPDVTPLVKTIHSYKPQEIDFCGKPKLINFSSFRPTTRYANSHFLPPYFRAIMWCSLGFDLGGAEPNMAELGTVVVFYLLLTLESYPKKEKPTNDTSSESEFFGGIFGKESEVPEAPKDLENLWGNFNSFLESIVGFSNCVNFLQLGNLIHSAMKLKNINEVNNVDSLNLLHQVIQKSELKSQYNTQASETRFAIMGRRFTIDNWATSKLTGRQMEKDELIRRRTSGVDVAFTVLGNNAATQILSSRINDTSAKNFRDGLPIQAHLESVRHVVDHLPENVWQTSLYMSWLDVLRSLSGPLDERVPQAMKTHAYAMKSLNTQLGSWAQLRHDNALYAEEDEDDTVACNYPDAYVEPIPKFWEAMKNLTQRLSDTIALVPFVEYSHRIQYFQPHETQQKVVAFFKRFSEHMCILKEISVSQLLSAELTKTQTDFLKGVVKYNHLMCGFGELDGWFYDLFFSRENATMAPDCKVTGVFSAKPLEEYNDPGTVLHVGVGAHKLMLICVERGSEVTMFAGPVYNYKEIDLPFGTRLNDEDWMAFEDSVPPPAWAKPYQHDLTPDDIYLKRLEKIQTFSKYTGEISVLNMKTYPVIQAKPIEEPEEAMLHSLFD